MTEPTPAESGFIGTNGYAIYIDRQHPLATARGRVYRHRAVLYAKVGPEPQPCHWCGKTVHWQTGQASERLMADHVDGDKTNNVAENLVPSCLRCNTVRGGTRAQWTHCIRGHEFTPENMVRSAKQRRCRICQNESARRRDQQNKAERRGRWAKHKPRSVA